MFLEIAKNAVLLFGCGALYQFSAGRWESYRNEPPGELYEVAGHKMHILAKGKAKKRRPTLVLTSGWGTVSGVIDMYRMQSLLAKDTRVVSYDRLGYGWSDLTSVIRDVDQQVVELTELLEQAGEQPPYLLVAHSLGTLPVLRFAQVHPEQVAGVVSLDGGSPEFYQKYNSQQMIRIARLGQVLRHGGVVRVLGNVGSLFNLTSKFLKDYPQEMQKSGVKLLYNKLLNPTIEAEAKAMHSNAQKVIDSGPIGEIPLLILTAEQSIPEKQRELAQKWQETQEEFVNWSNRSKHKVIPGATHKMPIDNADLLVDEITAWMKQELR